MAWTNSRTARHREPVWHDAPAVPAFLAAACGIACAVQLQPGPGDYAVLIALLAAWGGLGSRRFPVPLHLAVLAALAAVSASVHLALETHWRQALPEGEGVWYGTLLVDAAPDGTAERILRLTAPAVFGRPKLLLRDSDFEPPPPEVWEALPDGSRVAVHGVLRHPAPSGNPGEMNYAASLLRRGVVGTVYVSAVKPAAGAPGLAERVTLSVRRLLAAWRASVAERIAAHTSPEAGAVLTGMATGRREALDELTERAFQRTGISHLLAVSGLHVGIIAALAALAARVVRLQGWRRFAWVVAAVWAFVALTGARPSAMRAGLMATCGLLSYELRRRVEPLHFWALSGTALLLVKPLLLYDVGFQLSYAATGSILLWLKALSGRLDPKHPLARALAACAISLAAQAGTAVPIAYYFHELSLAGIVVNWVAVPLAAPVLMLTVSGVLLGAISEALGGLAIAAAGAVVDAALPALHRLAALPWSAWEVPAPSYPAIAAWGMLAAGLPLACVRGDPSKNRCGRQLCALGTVLLVAAAWLPVAEAYGRIVRVTFIDVGQGDAVLIRTPRGRVVLVDGGGSPRRAGGEFFDVGGRRLVPYLKHVGVRTVDLVVNTHPDEDHLQGLLAVLRQRTVRMVLDSGYAVSTVTYREYRELVAGLGVPYVPVQRGDVIELEPDIVLRVLGPPRDGAARGPNDASVVLRLETPHGAVLLTGDLGRRGQQELLWEAENVEVAADVMKVPHHGAAGDVDRRFIDAVAPSVAVIQVGRNRYGHPADAAIRAYEERGARVYRTDVHGAVTVTLAPWGVWVRTHR